MGIIGQIGFGIVSGITLGTVYGLFALGIVLVYRGTRVVNFAAPAMGSFALFIAHTLVVEQNVSWVTAAIMGVAVSGAIGVAFERIVVRRMGTGNQLAVAVATIGLMLLLISLELLIWDGAPRYFVGPVSGHGVRILHRVVTPTEMIGIAAAVLIGLALTQFLRRTDFGLGVQAAAMDPAAVRLVGVRLDEVSAFVWGAGGMLGAIAVLFAAQPLGAFQPGVMSATFFVPSLAAALLGGLDNLNGAFVGGLVIGVVDQVTTRLAAGHGVLAPSLISVFVVIVLVLLLAPNGLPSALRGIRRAEAVTR